MHISRRLCTLLSDLHIIRLQFLLRMVTSPSWKSVSSSTLEYIVFSFLAPLTLRIGVRTVAVDCVPSNHDEEDSQWTESINLNYLISQLSQIPDEVLVPVLVARNIPEKKYKLPPRHQTFHTKRAWKPTRNNNFLRVLVTSLRKELQLVFK